ncbi:MAG: hypothetical protein FWC32_08275 [Firmicutes bacterium]|nr:hypothetical protein [Bacillota bacterium]
MADRPTVYIKHFDGLCVPVTVRIEWLPNGVIKPLMYWTPDNSCYEIKCVYESVLLTLLRARGEGRRFKVTAVTETPEVYQAHRNTRHEVYLYLADGLFSGRNIIDERYGHGGKQFVPVTLDVFPDCKYEIICFTVQEAQYIVEKTIEIEPRGSYSAGGLGVWHKVKARQIIADSEGEVRMAALYFELNKWFVRIKQA